MIGSVERFDLRRRQWLSLPDMPQPVFEPVAISGHDTDNEKLSSTQAYVTVRQLAHPGGHA